MLKSGKVEHFSLPALYRFALKYSLEFFQTKMFSG